MSVPSKSGVRPVVGAALQQKDNLCGPFHGARLLLDAGVDEWEGTPVDQDLVALHAGTTLPTRPDRPQAPPGAPSLSDYRYRFPVVDAEQAGTTAGGLAEAIASLSSLRLACVPLRGRWNADVLQRLLDSAPALGARLIANLRTGLLWSSRPPLESLLAELAGGEPPQVPGAEWDVGHFVELVHLVRGRGGALVVVRDSFPSLGWASHYLQPPRAIAAALARGDGRDGGVLAVVAPGGVQAVRELAGQLALKTEIWNN